MPPRKHPITVALTLPDDSQTMAQVPMTWELIDHATDTYAKTLHEYDMSAIVKMILKREGKSDQYTVLPTAGNLDIQDAELDFAGFLRVLDGFKKKRGAKEDDLVRAVQPIKAYLLSGKHSKQTKVFPGWKRGLAAKKPMVAGTLSIDLPEETAKGYTCNGTQHYISFVYLKESHQLILFDSASKNPIHDKNEINYILYYTFDKPEMKCIPFKHILQPGAGDRSEEDPYSYNNQNVFCHTWSIWFLVMFFIHYDPKTPEQSILTIADLAHGSERLNLRRIKGFAMELLPYIYEPPSPESVAKKFPIRAYERAVMKNDQKRLNEILEDYIKISEPMTGLGYIYDYKKQKVAAV